MTLIQLWRFGQNSDRISSLHQEWSRQAWLYLYAIINAKKTTCKEKSVVNYAAPFQIFTSNSLPLREW